jgi:hypothetical protein
VICDGRGTPLAVTLTAANRNDITELMPLVDRVPPTGRHGKFRPKVLLADRAYVNHGQDEHNLNAVNGERQLAGSFENTPASGVRDLQVQLRPGSYTLFCSLPEHEQKGMKATLVVQ